MKKFIISLVLICSTTGIFAQSANMSLQQRLDSAGTRIKQSVYYQYAGIGLIAGGSTLATLGFSKTSQQQRVPLLFGGGILFTAGIICQLTSSYKLIDAGNWMVTPTAVIFKF